MKTVAIVNPVSGQRRATRKWPRLLETLGQKAVHVETWWTDSPGHAEILAGRARREGFERVVVIGGDGTLFEVVNGLWWEPKGKLPSVGMVPFGRGSDYMRNFETGRSLTEKLIAALGESVTPVDIGICRLQAMNGKPLQRIFVNVLGLGYDSNVVERLRRQRIHIPNRIAYVVGAVQELVRLKSYRLKGEVDGEPFETDALLLAIGLGRYFGGGMMITPGASPQAGRFQLVWAECLGRLEVLRLLREIYAGEHLDHPKVFTRYACHLKLTADPAAYVEAEGELIGRTPIEMKLYPAAFHFAAKNAKGTYRI